jgi:DnaJ-class molecular chaperone
MTSKDECPMCDGLGLHDDFTTCDVCNGTGDIYKWPKIIHGIR